MNKKNVLISALTLLMLLGAVSPALACSRTTSPTIAYGNAYGMDYTQITGTLSDAAYIIQIPKTWNGMLVVACPWYQFPPNPNCHLLYQPLSEVFLSLGYAFACSNYGADGYPIQKGMNAIHQLTEYVIDKYHVHGKVFVMGGSMGGNIALLLGEKYPHLYSGVLDLCGTKDLVTAYNGGVFIAGLSIDEFRAYMGWPATIPDANVLSFQAFLTTVSNDIKTETGGTPQSKPNAYAKISPVDNTDIRIPVISIVGGLDFVVPMSQHLEYQDAIAEAGHSDLYRMYVIPNGGHIDAPIFAAVPAHLLELVAWSNSLIHAPCHRCHCR